MTPVEDHADDMEIRTLPTLSYDSARLAELHGEWRDLQDARARVPGAHDFDDAMRDLARRIVEHRAKLFAVNAALQTESDAREPEASARLDANDDAIKFCTVMLGELSAALGTTSLPVTDR